MNLPLDEFGAYFKAVHGKPPFPWQERLLRTVLASGWPSAISLPTASGKTAVLDIAVFALAVQAASDATRTMPRRIALVVDRRIVVDDAYARAQKIREALLEARDGVLAKVAQALRSLGGEAPLDAAQLRGGIYREDRWARTPAQPVLLCSTVDQVGSRLLFRGYGLSASMWPVHAGLLGNDCLIILDEAHCSEPFRQTLAWISKLRTVGSSPLAMPFAVVTMTATPRAHDQPFTLDKADWDQPLLNQRLIARKLATLDTCGKKDEDFTKKAIEHLRALARPGITALVVVNRVATARELRRGLERLKTARADARLGADSILLTGRCRPLERERLLYRWRDRLMAGRDRAAAAAANPLIVVATQCVEVGADFDVDALITECCALDALRQRLGRLDRLGERGETPVIVLIREDQVGTPNEPADDPVYGPALSRTWHWLVAAKERAGTLDLGSAALDGPPGAPGVLPSEPEVRGRLLAPLATPATDAPVVFPAYCDLWCQTGPEPGISPDPAIFLHGPQRGEPDVRLVWRADLDSDRPETWTDTVSLCPPVTAEALPLPISQARRWLAAAKAEDDGGDVEGGPPPSANDSSETWRAALRWAGPEHSILASSPGDILPGDTLVLPAAYGGCDAEGWDPDSRAPVTDLADAARAAARRPAVLRLHSDLVRSTQVWGDDLAALAVFADQEWPDDLSERVWAAVASARALPSLPEGVGVILATLASSSGRQRCLAPHPGGVGLVLTSTRRTPGAAVSPDFSDEDATSAHTAGAITLSAHVADVAERARTMAEAVRLAPPVASDLALAGRLHDLGKADPRFQAWLADGDRVRARRQGLLAKSARLPANPDALRRARVRAGYPEGARHELLSVRLAESAPELLAGAHDRELVLHLIESHHGHCRAFAPVVFDDRPLTVAVPLDGMVAQASSATGLERLDSGVPDRFWDLVRRYGWWCLAYLEACLRLADHRASEDPARNSEEI